jgi:hypothetical protein
MAALRSLPRAERGQVLLIVAVLGLLAMALWMLAWRATHDAIRLERVATRRGIRAASVQPALAEGLDLLRTGRPPIDGYACIANITSGAGDYACTVTYSSQGSPDDWSVEARLATETEQGNLPPMPSSF